MVSSLYSRETPDPQKLNLDNSLDALTFDIEDLPLELLSSDQIAAFEKLKLLISQSKVLQYK